MKTASNFLLTFTDLLFSVSFISSIYDYRYVLKSYLFFKACSSLMVTNFYSPESSAISMIFPAPHTNDNLFLYSL